MDDKAYGFSQDNDGAGQYWKDMSSRPVKSSVWLLYNRTGRRRVAARCRASRHTLQGPGCRRRAIANVFFGLTLQGFATHCRAVRPRRSFGTALRPGSTDFDVAVWAAPRWLRRKCLGRARSRTRTDATERITRSKASVRESCLVLSFRLCLKYLRLSRSVPLSRAVVSLFENVPPTN